MFEDPKMKDVFRQQETAQLKQIYGDFVRERHLSPEQSKLLFDLLTEVGMRDNDDGMNFFSGKESKAEPNRTESQSLATQQAETDRQLRMLLGESNYAKLEVYDKTVSERLALVQIREQLDLRSTPLRDDQAKTLLQIMMEERARTPPMVFDPRSLGSTRKKFTVALEGDNAERYYEAQTDLNQRILQRAGTILSPEQYDALERFQKQHLQVHKVGIETMREMMGRQKDGADTSVTVSTPTP
jgi:hypothetical protein